MMLLEIVLGLVVASAQAADRPPIPYVDQGACPFECCTYRTWKATEPALAYSESKDGSPIAFAIEPGNTVNAETGFVVTSKVGVMKVLKPTRLGQDPKKPSPEPSLDLKPGELIYTLHYLGEGYELFWYKGKLYSDQIAADKVDPDPPPADFELQTLSLPDTDWWVKVRAKDGRKGWIKNPRNFEGTDSCS